MGTINTKAACPPPDPPPALASGTWTIRVRQSASRTVKHLTPHAAGSPNLGTTFTTRLKNAARIRPGGTMTARKTPIHPEHTRGMREEYVQGDAGGICPG